MQTPGLIRRILVPIDFSQCSEKALEYALALAPAHSASVEAFHVWTLPMNLGRMPVQGPGGETLELIAQREADRQMQEFLAPIKCPAGVSLTRRVSFGFEADLIVEAAKDFDLVVMGTNGRTGITYLVLGSIAEKVVRRSPCPVLTLRLAS